MELRRRVLKAGLWTIGSYGLDLAFRLMTTLVMTRLLYPAAFGVVAAASAVIVGLGLISDFGVHAVIIQSARGDRHDFLRSAWVFQISRGILLWLILLLVCAFISLPSIQARLPLDSVYADPSFALITSALGFGLVVGGLESTAISLNARNLNIRPLVLIDIIGKSLSVPVLFISAAIIPNAWALVIGAVTGSIVRVILSHTIVPGPRMAIEWSKEHFQEIVHFGKWITLSSIATFVTSQSDIIIFGLLLPSSLLGNYFIAKTLVGTVEGLLERLQSSMSLAIFGEVIRVNPKNLRDRYYRFRFPLDIAAGICAGALVTSATKIIEVLYDARYEDAGMMLRILAIGLALYPLQFIRSAFTAVGETRVVATVSIIEAASLITCLVVGFFYFGISGSIVGIAAYRTIPSLAFWFLAARKGWFSIYHELRVALFFFLGLFAGKTFVIFADLIHLSAFRQLIKDSLQRH